MSWTPLNFGNHLGRTLPQVLFCDPDWFFWAMENEVFAKHSAYLGEANDLYRKAKNIKVRDRDGAKMVVEHYTHRPTGKYSHFQVVPADQHAHHGSSPTVRQDVIDMSASRRLASYDKTGGKNLVRSLKKECFGSESARMTRERCEEFFDTPNNFDL